MYLNIACFNITFISCLTVTAPPSVPKKFFFSHIDDDLLVFGIEKGFNGGHEQTFIIEYKPFGMPEVVWSAILKINEKELDNPFSNGSYYINIPKIQGGQYGFRVYAENKKGNSFAIEGVHVEIKTSVPSPIIRDFPVEAVAGGVVGAIMVVIVIVVVAVVIKRQTLKTKMKSKHL
ncbi:hypothetical protein CHS0354_000008 [Potamilus streckersoni]|uniref:Uncharacterized protein n=1 Tax=Potamilus streckersoni TaxID=2493646 RepID=A0AAE0T292_9BIVA|nr:hypothetical protein CHS0354_000008 [Potamilus streckersoni]